MQPRSNSPPGTDASFLKLLGLWCRIGSAFVLPPVLLFLMSPIPGGRGRVLVGAGIAWLAWAMFATVCHWWFNQSLGRRFPEVRGWFGLAIRIRMYAMFGIVGEVATGTLAFDIMRDLKRQLGFGIELEIGVLSFIHGGLIIGSIIALAAIVGAVRWVLAKKR